MGRPAFGRDRPPRSSAGNVEPVATLAAKGRCDVSSLTRLAMALLIIAAVAAAGIIETSRTGQVGLLALFCAIALLIGALVVSLRLSSPVMVRSDLAQWLDATAALTAESTGDLVNRAISAYRASLGDDDRT